MNAFQIIALIISLTAIFNVVSERLLRLPKVIGPMVVALLLSTLMLMSYKWGWTSINVLDSFAGFDFGAVLMEGMLGFLLFAGALHIPIKILEKEHRPILVLAIFSTLISTFIVGTGLWWVAGQFGFTITYLQALTFGALISPTDPVAVLALLKNTKLPKNLEVIISGESLFNDAVGVVVFLVLSQMAFGEAAASMSAASTVEGTAMLLLEEVGGGIVLGLLLGLVAFGLLELTRDYTTGVLITLAVASGGYSLAQALHTSGPLAMVIAGLVIGNYGLKEAVDNSGRRQINFFWSMTDDILNSVLFVLIGFQMLVLPGWAGFGLIAVAIVLHLLGRFVGVLLPSYVLYRPKLEHDGAWWKLVSLLSWSGLRGGVSVALVFSLPEGEVRGVLLDMTYAIVVFSIFVQGLSINKLFMNNELRQISRRVDR